MLARTASCWDRGVARWLYKHERLATEGERTVGGVRAGGAWRYGAGGGTPTAAGAGGEESCGFFFC